MKKLLVILLVFLLPMAALAHTGAPEEEVISSCLATLGEEWMVCEGADGQPLFANGGSCAVAFVTDGARMSLAWFERIDGDWYIWQRTDEPLFGVDGLIPTRLDLYEEDGALFLDCRLLWDEKQLWVTAQKDFYDRGNNMWFVTEYTVLTPVDGWLTADDWIYLTKWLDHPALLECFSPVAQAQEPVVIEGSTLVRYPESRTDAYYAVPEGVEVIGENAFSGNAALVHVALPESVRIIEDGAFADCWNLHLVDMPARLAVLGASAFEQTYVDAVIPGGVTELGSAAFCYADLQGTVVIPEGVTDIGWDCFAFGYDITDMYLPASLQTIGGETFQQGAEFWAIWGFNSVDAGQTHMTVHAPAGTEAERIARWSGESYVIEDAREGTDLNAVTAWVQSALDEALPGAAVCTNEYDFPCVTYSADTVFAFAAREAVSRYDEDEVFLCCFDRTGNALTLRWVNADSGMPVPLDMTLIGDKLSLMLRLGEETAAALTFAGEAFRLSRVSTCIWEKDTGGPPPGWATMLTVPVTDGTPLQVFITREYGPHEEVVQGAVFDGDTVLLSLYDVIHAATDSYPFTFENRTKGLYRFELAGVEYEMNEPAMTLTRVGEENPVNLIRPAPGAEDFRSEIIDGRWMVDANTVHCTFRSFLGWPIRINIDDGTQTVTVCAEGNE